MLESALMEFLLAYLIGVLTAIQGKNNGGKHVDTEAKKCNSNSFPDRPISVVSIPPPQTDQERTKQKKKERRQNITFWVGIATLVVLTVYAGFTIAIWYANKKAAQAAKVSADTARDALVKQQRPWLGIDSRPVIEVEGAHWRIVFKLKNYGTSPALRSAFASETVNAPIIFETVKAKIEQACSRGEALTNDPQGHGYTIFPSAAQPQGISMSGTQTAVYLLGCLTYMDEFGALHHTRVCQDASIPLHAGDELTPCFGGQEAD